MPWIQKLGPTLIVTTLKLSCWDEKGQDNCSWVGWGWSQKYRGPLPSTLGTRTHLFQSDVVCFQCVWEPPWNRNNDWIINQKRGRSKCCDSAKIYGVFPWAVHTDTWVTSCGYWLLGPGHFQSLTRVLESYPRCSIHHVLRSLHFISLENVGSCHKIYFGCSPVSFVERILWTGALFTRVMPIVRSKELDTRSIHAQEILPMG